MKIRPLFLVFLFLWAPTLVDANQADLVKKHLKQTFELATAAYNAGEYAQAVDLYQKAIKIFPGFAASHYYLGMAEKKAGKSDAEVVPHFQKAVELQGNYAPAHEELARSYYAMARFDKAEEHGLRALELNPDNITTELTLGWTYLMGKSQASEAIDYFESALEKQKISYAYLGLGMSYFMTDQRAKVLEMVTFLRQSGKENLALQLEGMIRDPSKAPKSIPGEPLFSSPAQRKSKIVRQAPPPQYPVVSGNERFENMPVRLSAPLQPNANTQQTGLTGAERIRQMQQAQPKGSN